MAANSAERTDDLIVHLMSMGFDLTDCQDAISFGKISVETAVEWLIAGKPGFRQQSAVTGDPAGASLKLRGQTSAFDSSSSAFSKPVPVSESLSHQTASIATSGDTPPSDTTGQSQTLESDIDQSNNPVVSRLHLTDSQRKQKEGFEQKKRDEAKRNAVQEKKRQKEDHARVLKEIAADREKKKMLQSGRDKAEVDTPPVKEQKMETVSSPPSSENTKCLLQIRFPDGHSLRQSFSSAARLQEVWEFVQSHQTNLNGYLLIQPFPHHEFTDQEMAASLSDLKLTPSGSLVLQKKKVNQNTPSMDMDLDDAIPLPPRQPITGPTPVLPEPLSPSAENQPNQSHVWGQGHGLSDESVSGNESDMEEENEGEPEMVMPGFGNQGLGGMGFGNQGAGGIGLGNQGMAAMGLPAAFGRGRGMNLPPPGNMMGQAHDIFGMGPGHQQVFGGVGQRLVSGAENQPDAPEEAHGLRLARERALQRAEARQAHEPRPPNENEAGTSSSQPQLANSVQRLVTMCLKHIAHRLNDPRNPLLSLGGISEDMAQIILNYLLKEKQLKPRTLNPFIPCYLRQLILDTYPYTTNELIHAVRLHKNLSHLSLSACTLITDAGFQCLSVLKKLRQLNLSGCKQLTNKCSTVLCSLSSLVTLNLEDTGFTDPGVIQYLSSNPDHLTHLNLNRTGVTQAILSHLHTGAKQLKQLSIEDTQVESLLGIDQLPSLESLNVGRTRILPESLFCLVRCPCLSSLNIANTDKINGDTALQHLQGLKLHTLGLPSRHTTTDVGMQNLASFQLHSLDLTNYIFITDQGIQHIGQITSLKKLLLSNTKLTDEGMVYLGGLTNLEVLELDRTLITDVGAGILKELTKLTQLSLASTKLTSKCLLSGALNYCSSLIKLNLSKTTVTSRGVLSLTLPFLEMLNLDGTKVGPDLTIAMVTGCPRLSQMTLRMLVPFTRDDEIEEAEMEIDA